MRAMCGLCLALLLAWLAPASLRFHASTEQATVTRAVLTETEELIAEKGPVVPETEFLGFESVQSYEAFSPNLKRVAWKEKRGKRWVIVVNGQPQGPEFDQLLFLTFTRDGSRFGYWGKQGKDKFIAVVDGIAGEEFEFSTWPEFSLDGRRVAFTASVKNRSFIVCDGKPSTEFDGISFPYFSPDSRRLAYAGRRGDKWVLVVDGEEKPQPGVVTIQAFSPDSKRLAYAVGSEKKLRVFIDGLEQGPEFEAVSKAEFSPDSSRLAYHGKRAGKFHLVVDGREGSACDVVSGLAFSRDGQHFVYAGVVRDTTLVKQERAKSWVVYDGREGPLFESEALGSGLLTGFFNQYVSFKKFEMTAEGVGVSTPAMSADGRHYAYTARRGSRDYVMMLDGHAGPKFDLIHTAPVMSRDGMQIVYVGELNNKIVAVVNGQTKAELPAPGGEVFARGLTISPEGNRVAFIVGHGGRWFKQGTTTRAKQRVVIDGHPEKEYDVWSIQSLTFSADGQHFAYAVHGRFKIPSRVNIDGQEGKAYDEVLEGSLSASSDGGFSYLARSGRKFYRVVARVK